MSRGTTDVFMSRNGKRMLVLFFAGFLVFLYLPTILLTIFSFNASTVIGFPLSGFTTDFYEAAWQNPEIKESLFASLKVAAGTAVVATALAVLVSYALARRSLRFKAGVSALLLLPLVVPTVVLGVSLLVLFRPSDPIIPIPLGLWAVLIGHVVIALPFCVLLLLPRIASIDERLEEAAHDLGASGLTTFRRVILPLILPALLASAARRVRRLDRRSRGRKLPRPGSGHISGLPVLGVAAVRPDQPAHACRDGHDRGEHDPHPRGGADQPIRRAPRRSGAMRRLAVSLVVATALAAGCGGAAENAPAPAAKKTGPTEAQLAFRERILEEIRRGEYTCSCTAALRARERIEKGLVKVDPG